MDKTLSTDDPDESPTRYDDKTEDEMVDEMNRKRKQQFGKLVKFRYYQAGVMMGALFFYLFIYRKFLISSPVMHSITYNQALEFIKGNKMVRNKIGSKF